MPTSKTKRRWKSEVLGTVIGAVVVGFLAYRYFPDSALVRSVEILAGRPSAQSDLPTTDPNLGRAVSSVEGAQSYVVGIWTYVGPDAPLGMWKKWVFKADGSVESYNAFPADDGWGNPRVEHWNAVTGKYQDTGKRFFGAQGVDWARPAIVLDSGNLRYRPSVDTEIEFVRGDRFPFSK